MKKRKSILAIYLIVSLALIVCSVVLALTVGINFGTDIAGGTQIEVQVQDINKVDAEIEKIEHALKDNGVKAEKIFVEDKGVVSNIVVRINEKDLNGEKIRADIAIKSNISINQISPAEEFTGMVTNRALLWTSVGVVCLLLALFILGFIRYSIVGGISLMFTVLHSLILSLSMLIITRVIVSFAALIAVLAVVALVIFVMILTLEKLRENARQKHNENAEVRDLINEAKKEVFKPVVAIFAALVIITLCFVCVPVRFVYLTALALLVATVVGAYSYYFVGLSLHESLYLTKKLSEKNKLSRNNSPKPQKEVKEKKAKKASN